VGTSKIAWDQVYGTAMPVGFADVAILDTGIDATHPDLSERLVPARRLIDESQGRTDANGHGTWVAGIVAGRTNNLDGIAGVAYSNVQILPVKVLDAEGLGQDSDVIAGILWAVDHHASSS
jgi:subtilisin family serine protease